MSDEALVQRLVPVAAELVGTVRDYGPEDVAAILDPLSTGHLYRLVIVLAAMVDPDARPQQLLAWTELGPVSTREQFQPRHLYVKAVAAELAGEVSDRRLEVARLTACGLSAKEIADRLGITSRAVNRHRAALRATVEQAVA